MFYATQCQLYWRYGTDEISVSCTDLISHTHIHTHTHTHTHRDKDVCMYAYMHAWMYVCIFFLSNDLQILLTRQT